MEQLEGLWNEISYYISQNPTSTQIACLGVGGLLAASYKIRLFSKFTNPNKIPKYFFKKKVKLEGIVKDIEPGESTYILVDHKPLVPIPVLQKNKYLPVKIAGVNVNGNGISWLQTVVKNQKIEFIPVNRSEKYLSCIVSVPQNNKESLTIAKELIKLGFGTVEEIRPLIQTDNQLKHYIKSLKYAQKWAEQRRNGMWHFKYPPTLIWKIRNYIDNKIKSALPIYISKHLSV